MTKRKTNEEFAFEMFEKQGNKYQLLEEYLTAKTKILSKCNDCGLIAHRLPHDILKGSCSGCHKNKLSRLRSKTHEEFFEEVGNVAGYKLLSQYQNSKTKCTFEHIECGNIFEMCPNKFTQGQRCPKCSRPIYGRTHSDFVEEFKRVSGEEYQVIGEFTTVEKKTLVKHKKCGFTYEVSPHKFVNQGRRCPKCANNIMLTQEEFENRVLEKGNSEYEVLSDYRGGNNYVKMKHTLCGLIWNVKPSNFFAGKRCPKCQESKGEKEIERHLEKYGYKFERQFKIKECKLKLPLPFDFSVETPSGLKLIEYQGEQHYKARSFFGGQKALESQQKRDKIKANYCKRNNIELIIISYKDFKKISKILKDSL